MKCKPSKEAQAHDGFIAIKNGFSTFVGEGKAFYATYRRCPQEGPTFRLMRKSGHCGVSATEKKVEFYGYFLKHDDEDSTIRVFKLAFNLQRLLAVDLQATKNLRKLVRVMLKKC